MEIGGASVAGNIGFRNWPTPGMRLLGVRRVDAATGGPVTVRSAMIGQLTTELFGALMSEITRPARQRSAERMSAIAAGAR